MSKKNFIRLLVLLLIVVIFAQCKEDPLTPPLIRLRGNDPTGGREWKLKEVSTDTVYLPDYELNCENCILTSNTIISVFGELDSCLMDDALILKSDSTFYLVGGELKCPNASPDTIVTGIWSIDDQQTVLNFLTVSDISGNITPMTLNSYIIKNLTDEVLQFQILYDNDHEKSGIFGKYLAMDILSGGEEIIITFIAN